MIRKILEVFFILLLAFSSGKTSYQQTSAAVYESFPGNYLREGEEVENYTVVDLSEGKTPASGTEREAREEGLLQFLYRLCCGVCWKKAASGVKRGNP